MVLGGKVSRRTKQDAGGGALHFDVSTGLKSVLGRELITDEQVAVFELVKNSFDAQAKHVALFFGKDSIVVADDGVGMSLEDIREKWLFVAYSSKREGDRAPPADYRQGIDGRRHFAGSKGIGRFSSDRLGRQVVLQTRARAERSKVVHRVVVDWAKFDRNQKNKFDTISLDYVAQRDFVLPKGMPVGSYSTVIEIQQTHRAWRRQEILELKRAIAKLINPFGARVDGFKITVHAPAEAAADKAAQKGRKKDKTANDLVNGQVGNFIFSTLQKKTTFVEVELGKDDEFLESRLVDRGELIYRIREPNPYKFLKQSGFRCQLFFLNQSAKVTFSRRMGLPSVQFGSVFVFRNSFRVYPIGEEGDDWFGIDRRKQQGYARFLGTRDVIGRIDVSGSEQDFQEASSRNDGLIKTPAVEQLKRCFNRHCLQRLERYIVPVSWADKEDKNASDLSRLLTDPGKARVAKSLATLIGSEDIELLEYSKRLVDVVNERSSHFEESLANIRAIAKKTRDRVLLRRVEQAERRFKDLAASEAAARKRADEEREANEAAQARAAKAHAAARQAKGQLKEEMKRNLFLTSITSLDVDTILNMHHQITIYAVDLQQQIENFIVRIGNREMLPRGEVLTAMEPLAFLNRRVMAISKFATRANFRLQSEAIDDDLGEYIRQYVDGVVRDFLSGRMRIDASSDGRAFPMKFKPIDVSIVVDNLISNARKARASRIQIEITRPSKGVLHVTFADNGRGIHSSVVPKERVFEKGFSKTSGSGLGLFHVRQVLGEMGGSIEVATSSSRGATFLVRISA